MRRKQETVFICEQWWIGTGCLQKTVTSNISLTDLKITFGPFWLFGPLWATLDHFKPLWDILAVWATLATRSVREILLVTVFCKHPVTFLGATFWFQIEKFWIV